MYRVLFYFYRYHQYRRCSVHPFTMAHLSSHASSSQRWSSPIGTRQIARTRSERSQFRHETPSCSALDHEKIQASAEEAPKTLSAHCHWQSPHEDGDSSCDSPSQTTTLRNGSNQASLKTGVICIQDQLLAQEEAHLPDSVLGWHQVRQQSPTGSSSQTDQHQHTRGQRSQPH